MAEILVKKGFNVTPYPQHWQNNYCSGNELRIGSFVGNESPRALTLLNESLMSLLNATLHQSVPGVVDGFIVWECGLGR